MPIATKGVGLILATFSNGDGRRAHPGQDRLATVCGLSERMVRYHLAALLESGWVAEAEPDPVDNPARGRPAKVYTLAIPTPNNRK